LTTVVTTLGWYYLFGNSKYTTKISIFIACFVQQKNLFFSVTIKMKSLMPSAMTAYNRLLKADLVAIDDIMLFPVKKEDAAGFFNLINTLHEKASLIITTNKAPTEWAKTLDDEVLASAILDRLLYHCEVIKLSGQSYRMGNRKSIFETVQDSSLAGDNPSQR
jgi:DNA replication protein DnaC